MFSLSKISLSNRIGLFVGIFLAMNSLFLTSARAQFGIINTIAGTGTGSFSGDGGPATSATLSQPTGICLDALGNVYIADKGNNAIRKYTAATGIITTVAGTSIAGYTGDGAAATSATLSGPTGVHVDASGNIFIADFGNNVIRKVTVATGIITTVAGTGVAGFSGDGSAATSAQLSGPFGVWVEASGNIIFTDQGNVRVRKVDGSTGVITTIAGTGTAGFCCDGSLATLATFSHPSGICEDPTGVIYFCTQGGNARVRKIDLAGIIHTEMGNGTPGFSGDCGPDTAAEIQVPQGVASDASNNIYLATTADYRIRVAEAATSIIHTVAGDGETSFSGDGGSPLSAGMHPLGVAVDAANNIYIAGDNRVRMVTIAKHNDTVNFCQGDSAILGSAISYVDSFKWSTGDTSSSITVHSSGTYWVQMYICSYISTDTFIVNELNPHVHLGDDTTICSGATLTVFASDTFSFLPVTYLWSTGATTATINVTVSNSYVLTVTEDGCSASDTINVTVAATVPSPVLGSTPLVCSGSGLDLLATDTTGAIYHWSGPGGFTSTVQNPIIDPAYTAASGSYSVYATLGSCVSASVAENIIVDSCSAIHLPDSLYGCVGNVDTLHASITGTDSILSITWTPTTGLSSSTVLDPALTISGSGYYHLSVVSLIPDNLVINGNFTAGNTGFTSSYTYAAPPSTTLVEGNYSIYTDPHGVHTGFTSFGDHTTGTGNMMIINGGSSPSDVWCETISVTPNTDYDFSTWIANCSAVTVGADVPIMQFKINGVLIGSPTTITSAPGVWTNFFNTWNSGTSTTATICIYDENTAASGNDFALDDISFEPIDTAKDSIYVSATVTPPVHLGNDTTFCSGPSVTLHSSDTYASPTYLWSTGSTIPTIVTGTSGTYWLDVTTGGCTGSDTVVITVNPTPPVPSFTAIAPVCTGNPINFIATDTTGTTPALTFSWSGPDAFTSALQDPVINPATLAATGVYSLVVTLNGCVSPAGTIAVLVDSTPSMVTASSNSAICAGDTLRFNANTTTELPGIAYQWVSATTGYTSTQQNPQINNATIAASGIYSVMVTLNGICPAGAQVIAIVNPIPVVSFDSSTSPVCAGQTLVLYSGFTPTGGTYNWSGPLGFTSAMADPSILSITLGAAGAYSVSETLNGCTSDTAIVTVIVNVTPDAPIAFSNSPVCEHDTLKLLSGDATPGVSYSWSGPNSFTSTDQNPVIPDIGTVGAGIYEVIATLGGCTNTTDTLVAVTLAPTLTPTSNSPLCSGDTLLLFANAQADATVSWTGPYVFTSLALNPTRPDVITEYSGVYQVRAFLNNCYSYGYANDTVVINQTPLPPWVSWMTYCQYYPAPPLQANGTNILWYVADSVQSGVIPVPVPPTNVVGSTFYFTTQTVNGCTSAIDSIQVTVNPVPTVTVTPDTSICPHTPITLAAGDNDAIANYQWHPSLYLNDNNTATVTAEPETDISYTVVAGNQFGCADTAYTSIHVYPAALVSLGDSVTLYPGETYTMSPATNCTSFSWLPPAGLSSSVISDPVASPEANTKYIVYGTTTDGCVGSDSISIYISTNSLIAVPNAFTPGNGVNSEFKINKKGEASLNYFRVFNRWGQKVFETTNIDAGWDGTFKGAAQPFGVYVYEIEAVTTAGQNFVLHGNVTLLR